MKYVAERTWEGWSLFNYQSSDGKSYYQRVHVLAWGSAPIVRAIDKPEVPESNGGIPTNQARIVRLSDLYYVGD